jgi:hypothetical protein
LAVYTLGLGIDGENAAIADINRPSSDIVPISGGVADRRVSSRADARPRPLLARLTGQRYKPVRIPQSRSALMNEKKPDSADLQRQMALSRWDNEGGAGPEGPQQALTSPEDSDIPELTNAELVNLRVRVIALENLVIALLAGASDRQLDLAREMPAYISPRPGFTLHPLTIHAASHMTDLAERAVRFRS